MQVTGGSLEESREALKIAETDGLFCFCCLNSVELLICFQTLFLLVQPVVLLVGRLFCTVGVHPTRCKVVYSSFEYQQGKNEACHNLIHIHQLQRP